MFIKEQHLGKKGGQWDWLEGEVELNADLTKTSTNLMASSGANIAWSCPALV